MPEKYAKESRHRMCDERNEEDIALCNFLRTLARIADIGCVRVLFLETQEEEVIHIFQRIKALRLAFNNAIAHWIGYQYDELWNRHWYSKPRRLRQGELEQAKRRMALEQEEPAPSDSAEEYMHLLASLNGNK